MLKNLFRFALLCVAFISISGFGVKGMAQQKSVVPPDKTLYETGLKYLEEHQYRYARLALQTLINTYPDSDLVASSYLEIGNSYYDEGGRKNLHKAQSQCRDFIVFFPDHPDAAEALMKAITINMKMMNTYQDDPEYPVNADAAIEKYLKLFPDNDSISIVRRHLDEVSRKLAERKLTKITGYVAGPAPLSEVTISLLD